MITHLRLVRKRRGLEAQHVAKKIGVSKGYYCKLENIRPVEPRFAIPSPRIAQEIARFFGREVTEDQVLFPDRYLHEESEINEEAA